MKIKGDFYFYSIIPKLNILLSLGAFTLLIFLVFYAKKPYQPKLLGFESLKSQSFSLREEAKEFKDEIFKEKQLFNTSGKKSLTKENTAFVILGISLGKKNLAMIRDTAENKDYYCAAGDKIRGFTVKQILKDKVILESEAGILEITQ